MRAIILPGPAARRWASRGLLLIALLFLLRAASAIVLPILAALILTFVLAPAVRTFRHHRIPEAISAAMLVTTLVGTSVLALALLAEPAAQWWQRAPQAVSEALARVDRWRATVPGFGPPAERRVAGRAAQPANDPVRERLASESIALTAQVLGQGVRFVVSAAATTILLYFLLASEHWVLSRCIELLPPRPRLRAMVLGGLRAAQRDISRYVVSVGLINAGVGLATASVMWWVDLPNPGLWGAMAALMNFIPYLGPLIMAGLVLCASLASSLGDGGALALLGPTLAYLLIHGVEANVITPFVVGKRLAMNPLSVLLSVMFWGWLWGVAGAVMAVPLLICLRSISQRNRRMRPVAVYLQGSDRPCPSLRSLLQPTTIATTTIETTTYSASETRGAPVAGLSVPPEPARSDVDLAGVDIGPPTAAAPGSAELFPPDVAPVTTRSETLTETRTEIQTIVPPTPARVAP
ncbi:AI-2E family transporter [Roseateles amylovorans]|uniref:AI-2E family transporter n=1 Tax=Roseateles amylovorans TaxID=2978473 RepID=A0ABY6B6J1_9BURK|nr:AI-2E family transporter [Roseateles amylovorans]UXH80539.1 AI-2E family transporter [Roseateles amylovorans]